MFTFIVKDSGRDVKPKAPHKEIPWRKGGKSLAISK
jgi:hypothetical protein